MHPLEVVLGCDDNYAGHLAATICSLLQNNPDLEISINVLTENFSEVNNLKIKQVCQSFGASTVFHDTGNRFSGFFTSYIGSTASYLRLLIPDIIQADKCLYLDVDLIATGSLNEITSLDLGDNFLAAARDQGLDKDWYKEELGIKKSNVYFNAGVMMMNLKQWRKAQLSEKLIDLCRTNSYKYCDQDALNTVLQGKVKIISNKFNYNVPHIKGGEFAIIKHYCGNPKPDSRKYRNNDFNSKALYWKYRNGTPYRFPAGTAILLFIHSILPALTQIKELLIRAAKKITRLLRSQNPA